MVRKALSLVQNLLVDKYGLPSEHAFHVTHSFLRNFRKCPESLEMPLDEWRHLLWKKALGEQFSAISGDVYLEWLHLRYLYLAPSDEVLTLLRNLRNNYYLALITNGPSKSQWEKISRLELADYFHCILVSGDLPWEKPSKKIFLEACLHLRVSPEECIMVGDKLETDILGAVKASLGGSVWIPLSETKGNINININNNNNNNNSNNNGLVSPDFTIADVTQLPYLLPANPKSRLFNFRCPPLTRRFLTVSDPDLEDCNSNSSDGS